MGQSADNNAIESETARLAELVVELQTQLAFQEQAIADLSQALAAQQADIGRLKREWRDVQQRYASLRAQLAAPSDEKPPHY